MGHFGITTIAFVLSLYIFAVSFPSKLKRGMIKQNSVFHFIKKASTASALAVWFPRNIPINLVIYAGDKKV